MDMDIPLPGEEPPPTGIEPPDIPMPDDPPDSPRRVVEASTDSMASEPSQDNEPPLPPDGAPGNEDMADDSNRYSPSLPMEEDDLPVSEVAAESGSHPLSLPSPVNFLPQAVRSSTSQAPVLGKTQAKKRLLAFSMTKQGGGAGVSFNLTKKTAINKETAKGFSDEKDENKKKPPKKGSVDKARDTISEIEELKRKEMQLLENMQKHPHYGVKDNLALAAALPLQLVGEVLAKKSKREAERRKGRSRSQSEERHRSKSKKSDKDRERSKNRKILPSSWIEFKKEGHKLRHFRRFKYEVEKEKLRDKKRHRRNSRSRSKEKSKREKSPSKTGSRVNLLETPMVIKKVLVALDVRGTGDIDFPEYLVRYTKTRPPISYCENQAHATYHLCDRKTMMSSLPRDIEEIVVNFLNSIRSKRLRTKPSITEVSEGVKNVMESFNQLDNESEICVDNNQETGVKSCLEGEIQRDTRIESNEDPSDLEDVKNTTQEVERATISTNDDGLNAFNEEKQKESDETNPETYNSCDRTPNDENKNEDNNQKDSEELKIKDEESCNLNHRSWYQTDKEWMVVNVPLNEEEDVEVEELDVVPNVVINSEHFDDVNEEPTSEAKSSKKDNFKPRSRNISQSSSNVITEELEPIIKSAIRSKWDSDYEESDEDKKSDEAQNESVNEKPKDVPKDKTDENVKLDLEVQDINKDNLGVVPMEVEEDDRVEDESLKSAAGEDLINNAKLDSHEKNNSEPPDKVEKLAYEYEEFMKMLGSENERDEISSNSIKPDKSTDLNNTWEDEISDKENYVENDSLSINDSSHVQSEINVYDKQSEEPSDNVPKPEWEEKKIFLNRSRSPSPTHSVEMESIKEVILKHKLFNESLLGKKRKSKVLGSKIKKKSKDKHKKSKKKKKKHTSSDSSTSSSSSSSDSSSSSSSSSSSDDSSSDSSSSSSYSSSSSDSSIDLKKLKKRKLKKLKAKLRRKKKTKYNSSSESSESSEDEKEGLKKKNKKKVKESKKKKKKNKDKVARKKKMGEPEGQVLLKKQVKKKRKLPIDEEEEIEGVPKKKQSKIDVDLLVKAVKLPKKEKNKSKKTLKNNKVKKKKDVSSKKKEKLKKKSLKEKPKSGVDHIERKTSSSKTKLKKGEKKEKDLFLDFVESSKPSKQIEDEETINERQSITKTGIKMSEEDFDIPIPKVENKRQFYLETDDLFQPKMSIESKVPFLGNKRLTEEDFEKDVEEKALDRNNIHGSSICEETSVIRINDKVKLSGTAEDLDGKSKKRSKKEKKDKKKKKQREKLRNSVDIEGESDKKKKKKKKDKKFKASEKANIFDLQRTETYLTTLNKGLLEIKPTVSEQRCFRESSQESNVNDSINISPTRARKATNWSDDSETRGCFLKHFNDEIKIREEMPDIEEEKIRKIEIPDKIPIIRFDSQSGDEYREITFNTLGDFETKMQQLDEDFRISKEKRERDSFFENLLKKSDDSELLMSPIVPLFDTSLPSSQEKIKSPGKKIEVKESLASTPVTKCDLNPLSDVCVLQKELIDNKGKRYPECLKSDKLTEEPSNMIPSMVHASEKNIDSERYSPTLDLDPLSPNSNEKVNSDMSLESNAPEDSNSNKNISGISMLDIPLPPSGLDLQQSQISPVPAPVPPPVMPVPLPSFKNILNDRPQFSNTCSSISNISKNTEFKTTVSALSENTGVKTFLTDPLKIPITKKLYYGKPVPQLKQVNIFENDDDDDEEGESSQQNNSRPKFPYDSDVDDKIKTTSVISEKVSKDSLDKVCDITKGNIVTSLGKDEIIPTTLIDAQVMKGTIQKENIISINPLKNNNTENLQKDLEVTATNVLNTDQETFSVKGVKRSSVGSTQVVNDESGGSENQESENQTKEIPIKEEIVSDDQANNENIDSSNFVPDILIKQEPESDVSQGVQSDKIPEESQDTDEADKIQLLEEDRRRKEREDNRGSRRRESSRERRDRARRDLSRERDRKKVRSRSRSRDRRRDRYRRDSPDKRSRRRDRSRERTRRSSPKDRRRERSPRGRKDQSRDQSPRRRDSSIDVRSSEKRDSSQTHMQEKMSKQSPMRKSSSPHKRKPSPLRSPSPHKYSSSPLLKSPLYQKRITSSQARYSPSQHRSSPSMRNRSPSPRKFTSPRRSISPQNKPPSSIKESDSPQKSAYNLQRKPPSPQSPYNSPYRSPSLQGGHSPVKLSSPTRRYLSPTRRSQSSWRPPSPPKRPSSPNLRPPSPGKRTPLSLKNLPSSSKKSLSPWRPPSPPSNDQDQKKARAQNVEYSGRNPSPLGFKRSLADSTISDSDLPPIKKITRNAVLSPKRLPLDDRIELELGVKKSPPPPPPTVMNYPGYQSFYQIPVHDGSSINLQPSSQQHRNPNLVQPPRLDWDASQQLMKQGKSSKVLQVGNILQVVPSEALSVPVPVPVAVASTPVPPPAPVPIPPIQPPVTPVTAQVAQSPSKPTVLQVGNVLQVVPNTPSTPVGPLSLPLPPVSPSPPPPPAPAVAPVTSPLLLPLPVAKKNIKVDDSALRRMEKEKRKKEKELKRQQKIQKQMLRKALLLKDTYPTVSELETQQAKLEAEDTAEEVASIPHVVVTPKARNPLPPPPEKGILISPGFRERPLKEEKIKKNVSFADGVQPGEGEDPPLTEEHPHSPPPMAKEKRFKKSKKKRKVKVRIIRVEDGDDDEEDDSTPPPPPPGSPPPMFHYPPPPPGFMYVPPQSFTVLPGSTPLYQQHHSTTTTTHTTTVQFAPHHPPPPSAPLHKTK
ncbi:uncharacterized protein LOC128998666 isoform X2 [Macrosteles quadrilineatus]|uniref:uncharacterized protein LOC128998666 isoform X2 n=1 Tax=Macrosteles quadrilineatus TaxID=74068 RepID=UPI0023E094D1|nr:uncharacterized protein LOC128998666 isoform X2 [Macrosteles quadrilineatus]